MTEVFYGFLFSQIKKVIFFIIIFGTNVLHLVLPLVVYK